MEGKVLATEELLERLKTLVVQQGDPLLTTRSDEVDVTHKGELVEIRRKLTAALNAIAKLYDFQFLGLSAIQIGIPKRVFAIRFGEKYYFFFNPEIELSDEEEGAYEGCLSFFGTRGWVVRPNKVLMRWYDLDAHEWVEKTFKGFLGRMVQHEFDHLEGILYTTRMAPGAATMTLQEYLAERGRE